MPNKITNEVLQKYKEKAKQGHVVFQRKLAFCYEFGNGIRKNYKKAAEWYTKAAEQGDARSQNSLAYLYDNGYGVPKSHRKAFNLMLKAAKQGLSIAQHNVGMSYRLGDGIKKDNLKAFQWLKKSAMQGFVEAEHMLSYCYGVGEGTEKNNSECINWCKKAVAKKHPIAINNLGYFYQNGMGVPISYREAVKWYKKADRLGVDGAAYKIGYLYENGGNGFKIDHKKAIKWYTKAASDGDQEAKKHLKIYKRQIKEGWAKVEPNTFLCNCCGRAWVGAFDECPVCGWTDDFVQERYPNMANMANNTRSLNKARKDWKEGKSLYYIKADKLSLDNRQYLSTVKKCGCYYCQKVFSTNEIKKWNDDGKIKQATAVCPHCDMPFVIGEGQGYPLTKRFLKAMHKYWF